MWWVSVVVGIFVNGKMFVRLNWEPVECVDFPFCVLVIMVCGDDWFIVVALVSLLTAAVLM